MRAWLIAGLVRPLCWLFIGPRIVNRGLLPKEGPALIVANHNSDLDTPMLLSLLSRQALRHVRVAAAADRFNHGLAGGFARALCPIIPIRRDGGGDPTGDVIDALDQDAIVIFFPEGTRGEPEVLARFRSGIARIAQARPCVPVIPVALAGLGKSLPKGCSMPLPIECDVIVGEALRSPRVTPDRLRATIAALLAQRTTAVWELGLRGTRCAAGENSVLEASAVEQERTGSTAMIPEASRCRSGSDASSVRVKERTRLRGNARVERSAVSQ